MKKPHRHQVRRRLRSARLRSIRELERRVNFTFLIQDSEGNFIFILPPKLRNYTWIFHPNSFSPYELKRNTPPMRRNTPC